MSKINIDKNWYNETTKEFDCPYCKKGYSKKGISTHILRTHLYVEHYKNINYNNMQEKHIRENCEHCNKSFSIKYLEKHKIECLKKINNIYICEKCGINTNIKYGSGRFCSVKCANKRENLECLCPNCHSQTDTWRGRNQKRKQNRISDEELLLNFYKFKNIRQTLIYLNMTPKGKNYERFKSVLTKHNINYI